MDKKNYFDYSTGYNYDDLEHDLQLISSLMHGKKHLTMQSAQDIYYKIKKENIEFKSEKGEEFLNNLHENMTDAQMRKIEETLKRKAQNRKNRQLFIKINRYIAVSVSVIVLAVSVICINWSLIMDVRTNYQTKKLQAKIIENTELKKNSGEILTEKIQISESKEAKIQINETKQQQEPDIMGKFTQLYSENNDFAGWLRIPGTKIDYPVMSRDGDNNYYLDKNFDRKYDKNGLLILDYRNDVNADRQNMIIYGHNMRTGVMFGTLKNYKDKSFCDEHDTIKFDTLYEECEYKVVAAMLADVAYEDEDVFRYYDAIDISTEENFNAFKENVINNAIYTTDETIEYGDSCLILSTCDNYKEDGRFVVIAKRV